MQNKVTTGECPMNFDELPLIPAGNVYRAARVSGDCGERKLEALTKSGAIKPVVTPTGRTLLSPRDGKRVFEAITKAA
jgi:hypothetical protein